MPDRKETLGATKRYEGLKTPAVERLIRVAEALDESLRSRVVFIGASILPLLQLDKDVFGSQRPTKDVDGVVVTQTYTEKARIEENLRALKFRHEFEQGGHADKWRAPDGTRFDLVSCGKHAGGTGSEHDRFAFESSESLSLPPQIRHASAIGFLLLKSGAFWDRGKDAPVQSKDLTDLVVLVATRPQLSRELEEAPEVIRLSIRRELQRMLETPIIVSAISNHVRDREPLADDVDEKVLETLRSIVAS